MYNKKIYNIYIFYTHTHTETERQRETEIKELAHVIMWAGKSEICRAG